MLWGWPRAQHQGALFPWITMSRLTLELGSAGALKSGHTCERAFISLPRLWVWDTEVVQLF